VHHNFRKRRFHVPKVTCPDYPTYLYIFARVVLSSAELSFFPLYTIPSSDAAENFSAPSNRRGVWAHAERVVDCQVGHCIQVIGCRASPSLPPSCIMQEGCPHLMQGGHGGILAANGIPPETAECTSPRQRGHWIRAIGACARPTSQRASSCQAGRCIQAIGCRAMGPRRPLAPARGWPRSGNERGRVFCTRVNCAGRANHGTPAQGSPEAQARVPLVGGAAGSEQSERVLVRHARGRLRPPKPLGVAQGNQAGAWLEPEAWVPLSQWVEWIFFALMLEWPTAACRRMSPQRYGAPNVTIMSAKLTTALPTLPCHACRPHLITRRHRLQANSAAPRYSPTAVHCRRNSAHCQGRLSTAS
jgi:hypothetical protein